jgi:L-ascorbate metabolism protein UlaG (beta-lactamase superfamily)
MWPIPEVKPMKIVYLGHSALRIETGPAVILVDPFLTGNPAATMDWRQASAGCTHVLLTHGHDDHVGDALAILKATGATLVANFEICTYLHAKGAANYSPGNHGGRIALSGFDVVFTSAWHSSSSIADGKPIYLGNAAGFVVEPHTESGKTLYIAGDTSLFLDMRLIHELYRPAIGILPIGDRFTMGAEQAAHACRHFFDFQTVIPCHYGSFKGFVASDARAFLGAMGELAHRVKVMAAGETAIF